MKCNEISHIYLQMGRGAFLANLVMLSSQFSIINKPQHLKIKYNKCASNSLAQNCSYN